MNKFYIYFLIFILFCKTSENRMNDFDESQQKRKTTLYVSIEKQETNLKEEISKKQESENFQKEENVFNEQDYQKIVFYKTAVKEMEEQYILDKKKYNQDKSFIQNFKKNQEKLEKEYEEYKINYIKQLEKERLEKKEKINQFDPENKMFWRIDFNSEFPEVITIKLFSNTIVRLCEVDNPMNYLIIKNFSCNTKVTEIKGNDLKDINFLETLPLLHFLPKKKANYLIYIEQNQKKIPIQISNSEKELYTIAFIEINERSVLKIHLYTIKSDKYKPRYYFKTIAPVDFLLSLSE